MNKQNYKQPLVSIIMNCYNGEIFLKEAIDSVINQTYKNWELIFWDNKSHDKDEIARLPFDDPKFPFLRIFFLFFFSKNIHTFP